MSSSSSSDSIDSSAPICSVPLDIQYPEDYNFPRPPPGPRRSSRSHSTTESSSDSDSLAHFYSSFDSSKVEILEPLSEPAPKNTGFKPGNRKSQRVASMAKTSEEVISGTGPSRVKDPPRSSKGKESSLSSDEVNCRVPKHLSRVIELLVKGVPFEEEKRCAQISSLSLAEETALKSLLMRNLFPSSFMSDCPYVKCSYCIHAHIYIYIMQVAHSALKLNDRVEFQRGQTLIQEEKCISLQHRLKKVEWELSHAQKSVVDFEQLVAKKDEKCKELTKKNEELESEISKKDQVFTSSLGVFEKEIAELKESLDQEKIKVLNYQSSQKGLKEFADEQYIAGVEAATLEFKRRLPDADWSFLDEPMDETPTVAAVGSTPSSEAPADPSQAPGSSASPASAP